jgi:hypothetical protein
MNIFREKPPQWAESLLNLLLPEQVRETIIGDLREEYVESVHPRKGRIGSDLWYLRQVLSFLPWISNEGAPIKKMLLPVSVFTLGCASWLAFMEILLHHPGFVGRTAVAVAMISICASTILARILHVGFRSERWLWLSAALLIGIGGQALIRNAHAAHFEGFAFVIALVLLLQGAVMLTTLGRASDTGWRSRGPIAPLH